MKQYGTMLRGTGPLVVLIAILGLLTLVGSNVPPAAPRATGNPGGLILTSGKTPNGLGFTMEKVSGRLVWLEDAIYRKYDIRTELPSYKQSVVIVTPERQIEALLPDDRGLSAVVDERLREQDFEFIICRYEGSPYVQIAMILERKPEGLYSVDYWCDVCSIPMYIIRTCECCQAPNRLRKELTDESVFQVR